MSEAPTATTTATPPASAIVPNRVTLTFPQHEALSWLSNILDEATKTGLLDVLQPYCRSPDAINDVCEAVTFLSINQHGEKLNRELYFVT